MAKPKRIYVCGACGAEAPKWSGQCGDCQAWNTLSETVSMISANPVEHPRFSGFAGNTDDGKVYLLSDVIPDDMPRIPTGVGEFDRVLGGGLVSGSVVLIGGDPGIGKSTILLQTMVRLGEKHKTLYVTGEESLQQIGRAHV